MNRTKITIELKKKFTKLWHKPLTIREISEQLGIKTRTSYYLQKLMGLPSRAKWQVLGIPDPMPRYVESVVLGTLLGDGSLYFSGRNKWPILGITHSPKQKEYLSWKRERLIEIKPSIIRPSGDKWGSLRFTTPPFPELDTLYKQLYIKGKKTVTRQLLDRLDELAITTWFMDDGGALPCGYSLATCSFSGKEHETMARYFQEKWNIEASIRKERTTGYHRLYFNLEASEKFKDILEPHIITSMKYKLIRTVHDV